MNKMIKCKKSIPILLILALTTSSLFFVSFINNGSSKHSQPPMDYYQGLEMNRSYVYNVTQFQGPINWLNFNGQSVYNASTNPGGQIKVNFTGFYEKDSEDSFNLFTSPIPYMDVKFFEMKNNMLELNHTFFNVSNGETAFNLLLGYNEFQSGFLIPFDNFTTLQKQALAQNSGFMTADITVEESYNFISFNFQQISGSLKSHIVYDKESGLLVSAKTSGGGFLLEITLTNFSFSEGEAFEYTVNDFGGAAMWYDLTFNYIDLWQTNINGTIIVNYTGTYTKPLDFWGDVFSPNLTRAWFGINIFFKGYFNPILILSFNNISNREAATNMMLGFNDFHPGFFIPRIDNLTYLKQVIEAEANGFVKGDLTLKETDLTLYIKFEQEGGGQNTILLYEKKTGLLLYANTEISNYRLEMIIENYTLPNFGPENALNPLSIPSYSTILVIAMLITFTIIGAVKIYKKK